GLEVGSIRCIQGLNTAYWGFLRVGTTLDIFQNIIFIPYFQYGVLVFWIRRIDLLSFVVFGECRHGYFLLSQEFSKGVVDPTLFTRKEGNDILLVKIYVDDIIFASTDPDLYDTFSNRMSSKFKMSMMGKMSFFLGLQISQSPGGIFINQSKYALEILKKYGMESSDLVDTPLVERTKLDEDLQGIPVDPTRYRGTINMVLWYSKNTGIAITTYVDADHAECQDIRRSTLGSDVTPREFPFNNLAVSV
ncbi:retrovirus-related pol polyprotein from transposon TNT 1-94, partial [Tanacetum coccineum]